MAVSSASNAILGSGVVIGTVQVLTGTGVPSITAPKGSLFVRVDATTTTTRLYINTDGSTTWTTFTTAA